MIFHYISLSHSLTFCIRLTVSPHFISTHITASDASRIIRLTSDSFFLTTTHIQSWNDQSSSTSRLQPPIIRIFSFMHHARVQVSIHLHRIHARFLISCARSLDSFHPSLSSFVHRSVVLFIHRSSFVHRLSFPWFFHCCKHVIQNSLICTMSSILSHFV